MKAPTRPRRQSSHANTSRPQLEKSESHPETELMSLCAEKSMQSDPFWPPISDPWSEKQILEDKGRVAWIDSLEEGIKPNSFVTARWQDAPGL